MPVVVPRYKVRRMIWLENLDTTTPLQMSDILPQVNDEYAQKEYWCDLTLFTYIQSLIISLTGSNATKGRRNQANRALFSTST